MRPRRFHGLKRPKLRQTWNKYNLYNIHRFASPDISSSPNDHFTFFQKKWKAKGMLRAYHGEHVVERKWVRMFDRRLLGVANMDAKSMAESDGSDLAAGRGSGKEARPNWDLTNIPKRTITPYMQMAFAPMERRLDIAVFRAMFASSARQARQFCVHGAVKVNGKVMPHPAYRLNPGDMFQVDPEFVMYATGRPKGQPKKKKKRSAKASEGEEEGAEDAEAEAEAEETEAAAAEDAEAKAAEAEQDPDTTDAPEPTKVDMKPTQKQIQTFVNKAKAILADEDTLGAKHKQMLRSFIKETRSLLSRTGRADASPAVIIEELTNMVSELDLGGDAEAAKGAAPTSDPTEGLTKSELKKFEQRMAEHLREEEENPYDPTKRYRTPWHPRDYMAPFAFIPQYLEVNQNVCAAVYLRHPVARLGSAEVPTPFPYDINQLAYNWYLRRR
ncbi:alpha-L RNA-binding motif-containing protein [Durotheca rogersii]|uniref:alpha-L RNA-binding motif-containing protein n=1 Tax=Durotheca rogersii TaxID=419775 RepID=UPI00221FB44C|nr:alpha-L RNA-binding motif-containing protein [Durotheca rogersii]KAI5866559.1 alpha-L RNA-binding motif-containing protein [Durotheca rogersii]